MKKTPAPFSSPTCKNATLAVIVIFAAIFLTATASDEDLRIPLQERSAAMSNSVRASLMAYWANAAEGLKTEMELRKAIDSSTENDRAALQSYVGDLIIVAFGTQDNKKSDEKLLEASHREDLWGIGIGVCLTPRDIVLEAVVPELGPGGRMRNILTEGAWDLRNYLEHVEGEGASASEPRSIDEYLSYLSTHDFNKSRGLVEHLFKKYPERSFVGLVAVRGETMNDRDILLSHHHELWAVICLSKAPEQKTAVLDEQTAKAAEYLSKHAEWWVRLYVSEVMRQYPPIRIPEIVERLSRDEEELVRISAAGMVEPKKTEQPANPASAQ